MIRIWIKSILSRSLFGRAMLILAVPVIVIQIVVAIFFAERLFRDVSEQMSENLAFEINYIVSQANDEDNKTEAFLEMSDAARPLNMLIDFEGISAEGYDVWLWYDLSGQYVVGALRRHVKNLAYVDLQTDRKSVNLVVVSNYGPVELSFSRRRASATNPHQLLVAMLLTALIFTGISVLFLNNQIKPIKQLSDAAEAFGRGWAIPFSPRGAREIRIAGHSFLAMRARIIRQIEQRTMMLSGVSHDLRTPLTRMKLSLGLLDPSDEVDHLRRDVDEMEAMVTEFLEFARGDSEEKSEIVGIKALSKRTVRNFKRSGSDIKLIFAGDALLDGSLKCRERAVHRAIENLLGNAVRYGDLVRLTVTIHANHVDFIVEDNGPGIPEEKREAALEPFSRLDSARNQNIGVGSGLGLAIATDVAGSHGGKLELLQSDDLGGLKAVLSLPK